MTAVPNCFWSLSIHKAIKRRKLSNCHLANVLKYMSMTPRTHLQIFPAHFQIYDSQFVIIGKASPWKWTIIHTKFPNLFTFLLSSTLEKGDKSNGNKMNISFFVGFHGDTRGINIYLCNNFLLFFRIVISFCP